MRKFWAIASALAASVLIVTMGAAVPASAASRGYAYIVVGTSPCTQSGGEVNAILMANSTAMWSTTAWDSGDNVVYPQVLLGVRNNLQIKVSCAKRHWWGWEPTGSGTLVATVLPTANQQWFHVG